jgi:NADPH:quinone reductase
MEASVRGLVCNQVGSFENLEVVSLDDPVPQPGEVLVRVASAAVNYVDALIVLGKYQLVPPTPFIPGVDIAGTIVAVGPECTRFTVGDRVHGLTLFGGFAESVAVSEDRLRPTPDGLGADLACTTGTPYRTAYDALISVGDLQPGQDLVILGAAGAVGSAAITVGKAVGARVIACASTPTKRTFCERLGADVVLDSTDTQLKSALKAACNGTADLVLDPVGGSLTETALRAIGFGGRLVVVGFASGQVPKVPLNLVLLKGSSILGYEIVDFESHHPARADENRTALESLLAEGVIAPPIEARYLLDDGAAALQRAASRDKLGLTVLKLDDTSP